MLYEGKWLSWYPPRTLQHHRHLCIYSIKMTRRVPGSFYLQDISALALFYFGTFLMLSALFRCFFFYEQGIRRLPTYWTVLLAVVLGAALMFNMWFFAVRWKRGRGRTGGGGHLRFMFVCCESQCLSHHVSSASPSLLSI